MSNYNWSNEEILEFLEHYQAEPCIWDPRNEDHKDKKKVADAWNRLSDIVKKPVKEIKNKKEILMVSFRKHLKRKQDSIRYGSGVEDIYEPVWFAYQLMESFLLPIYTSKSALNSEMQSRSSETAVEEIVDEGEETEHYLSLPSSSNSSTVSSQSTRTSKEKCRRTASNIAEQQMATAFTQLTNVLTQHQSCANAEEDECDLYAKLLAKKMRRLPEDDRKLMMYEIDGLFIKRINQGSFSFETPSPQYSYQYSGPSSASNGCIAVPNRSAHAQMSFSEPSTPNHDPFHTNPISNFGRSSTPLPPSQPRNRKDTITVYSTKSKRSKPTSRYTVIPVSDEITVPQRQNIIHEAFHKAFDDFQQVDTSD